MRKTVKPRGVECYVKSVEESLRYTEMRDECNTLCFW